jgi:hypothetical protein
MSTTKTIAKKTVRINENDLVDLIDNIVNEAVAVKKAEWIAEQATKGTDKTAVLEGKIAALEASFKKLTEGKK